MKIKAKSLTIETNKELEFIDITDKILEIVKNKKIQQGFVNIYSRHTTLAIKINENESLLIKDFKWLMKHIIPEDKDYNHDKLHLRKDVPKNEKKNAKGHLRCMLMQTSQIIPIINGKLFLGKWQRILLLKQVVQEKEI